MRFAAWLSAGCLLAAPLAQAADADGAFAFKGAGLRPCAALVEAVDAGEPVVANYAGWLTGFISGVNLFREDTFDIAPWQSTELLLTAVVRHCRDHRDVPVHTAVVRMLDRLAPDRLRARSDLATVFVDADTALLYAAVIERLQRRLADLGHYAVEATGRFDDATREALTAFQADAGLDARGFPDQATLFTLFASDAPGDG